MEIVVVGEHPQQHDGAGNRDGQSKNGASRPAQFIAVPIT
jgi:hypothetical protein